MKTASFILTTTACLAAAVVLFFGMILGMNGYSESDATWGMGTYVGLSVLVSILAGGAGYFLTGKLIVRKFRPLVALLIAVPALTIVAVGVEFICLLVGLLVSEFVRTHF